MFLFCLVFAMFCARLFICASWSPAGKGLTSWLSFVVSSVSLSLSHWCPGSGVVLDCIDSWSLQPYLLLRMYQKKIVPKSHEPTHNFIYPRQESSHIPKSYFRGNAHPQFSGSAALKLKMLVKYPARIPKFHNSRSRKLFFNYRFL